MVRFSLSRLALSITLGLIFVFGPAIAADWDVRSFTDCITNSGAKYYGAYWCPYCRKQNALFGKEARYLPYVECSAKGSRKQLNRCSHISGYPTWIFGDGRKRSSVLTFSALQNYTGCKLQEKDYFVD